jgi:enamine deaminase RidA (YjgF/YER057c/UK114 family)
MTSSLTRRTINAPDAPDTTARRYSQAVEVSGAARTLYVSGQVPGDFEAQARQPWANVGAQLHAAGMSLDNLVKVLSSLPITGTATSMQKCAWRCSGSAGRRCPQSSPASTIRSG